MLLFYMLCWLVAAVDATAFAAAAAAEDGDDNFI